MLILELMKKEFLGIEICFIQMFYYNLDMFAEYKKSNLKF